MEQGVGRSSRKPHSPGQARRSASTRRRGRLWINFQKSLRDTWATRSKTRHPETYAVTILQFCVSMFLVLVVYLGCVPRRVRIQDSFQSSLLLFGQQERRGRSSKFNRVSLDIRSGGESSKGRISAYRIPGGGRGGRERESPRIIPLISSFVNENILYRFVGRLQSSSRLYFCYYGILYT